MSFTVSDKSREIFCVPHLLSICITGSMEAFLLDLLLILLMNPNLCVSAHMLTKFIFCFLSSVYGY